MELPSPQFITALGTTGKILAFFLQVQITAELRCSGVDYNGRTAVYSIYPALGTTEFFRLTLLSFSSATLDTHRCRSQRCYCAMVLRRMLRLYNYCLHSPSQRCVLRGFSSESSLLLTTQWVHCSLTRFASSGGLATFQVSASESMRSEFVEMWVLFLRSTGTKSA